MITKIGVIYQDRNSLGFLLGLRDRLKCRAQFVDPPARIGRPQVLPPKGAERAWAHFKERRVDLVIRFTDADRNRWQDVRRDEMAVVPDEAKSMWLCGVAVNDPEEWMCRDAEYLAEVLSIPPEELQNPANRTGRIKRAIGLAAVQSNEDKSETVARIVRDAPAKVFRRWLEDDALRSFYSDCRAAATADECETHNELEATDDE